MELSPREQVRPPSNTIATLATTAGSLTHTVSPAHPSRAEHAPSRYGLGRSPPLLSSNIHGLHPATTLPCTALPALATAIFALARLAHCISPQSTRDRRPHRPGLAGPPIAGKCGCELSLHHLALRSLSHVPQHAVCPVAVPTGTGPRTLTARIAVPTGPGLRAPQSAYAVTSTACLPGPTLAQLLASARRPPGRRPYRHGPAEPCDGLRSQALSRPPPDPMLALLPIYHAVCPVAVITGTGLLAHNGSRSRELRPLPEPTSRPTTATSRSLPGRRPYRHGPADSESPDRRPYRPGPAGFLVGIRGHELSMPPWLYARSASCPSTQFARSSSLPARACGAQRWLTQSSA